MISRKDIQEGLDNINEINIDDIKAIFAVVIYNKDGNSRSNCVTVGHSNRLLKGLVTLLSEEANLDLVMTAINVIAKIGIISEEKDNG